MILAPGNDKCTCAALREYYIYVHFHAAAYSSENRTFFIYFPAPIRDVLTRLKSWNFGKRTEKFHSNI